MPIVDPIPQVLRNLFQVLHRLVLNRPSILRASKSPRVRLIELGLARRRVSKVVRVWAPIALGHLHRDQTRQGLLLA